MVCVHFLRLTNYYFSHTHTHTQTTTTSTNYFNLSHFDWGERRAPSTSCPHTLYKLATRFFYISTASPLFFHLRYFLTLSVTVFGFKCKVHIPADVAGGQCGPKTNNHSHISVVLLHFWDIFSDSKSKNYIN